MIRKFKNHTPVVPDSCYVFPTATIIGDVTLGENVIVYPGTVIRGEHRSITIGDNTNLQENCTVHIEVGYDVHIGSGVTIGHNAIIHACTIHDNVLIGMGAIIQDGVVIGENCFIGAGALLRRGMVVEPGSMVYGFPAHRVRDITEAEYREIRESTEEYQISRREFLSQDREQKEF
ncbi:gamma carbonic anhydrase family protein [Anaerotignum lactatifermentans]|uniref:Gamma carbonic anhydrase family protein n=1 Tax=Anaerotignum lactatifermentans TaxID=160404 RepID=A0ABS2G8R9_9FIRM|nr:gamma carbonic anhydrase family protein [Anaerotignum lactatifermentans]MBM6828721.1 gamma carbonic anhydrase family protein [Anaerotignum lactatifermentans]MBM6877048.1 gamma carbonic anhydrase family protein [Anaerotignum lactatifermentans]MBM6950303.1 gamma carbonic anhydrase family protein [Anaerotignum lactatifermentans]